MECLQSVQELSALHFSYYDANSKVSKAFLKAQLILPPYNLFVHSFSLQTFTAFPLWMSC